MKSLATRNEGQAGENDTPSLLMTTVPAVMAVFKGEMRANRPAGLSVPQFRALIYIDRREGASISNIAEHLGLALSTTSKLVDGLVKREYVKRATAQSDRRRAIVTMTVSGRKALDATRALTLSRIKAHLSRLTDEEEQAVLTALNALQRVFQSSR